jgi:hypothetical protein
MPIQLSQPLEISWKNLAETAGLSLHATLRTESLNRYILGALS